MYTFTYQKTLLYTLFCLFLKSPKAFSVSLIKVGLFMEVTCLFFSDFIPLLALHLWCKETALVCKKDSTYFDHDFKSA